MAGRILKIGGGGGAGNPGGANLQLQWNNAGAFGGCAQLFWDSTNDRLGLGDSTPAKQLSITECMEMLVCSGSGVGVLYKGADRFMHDFKHANANGQNTFVGELAGNFSMDPGATAYYASTNTAVGYGALQALTTGYGNLAFGHMALASLQNGYYNCAFGRESLRNLTNGSQNMAIGYGSLYRNPSGSYNVAIGELAGYGVHAQSIIGNVLIGRRAGQVLTTGGNYNILLGYKAGDNVTSGEKNILIGFEVDAIAAAGDYQLDIAGTIFGNLGATKRIGIGTSTMNETLNVGGAIRLGTSALTNNGAIRWTGTDFEGYMTGWKSLTILKGLNEIFTTQGDLVLRGAANPERLASVAIGASLTSMGIGASPGWYKPMTTTGDITVEGAVGYGVRLAAGANNHVLTSNGAGTVPSWQAAGGGATKEFFVPFAAPEGCLIGAKGTYGAVHLIDNLDRALINFRVPHDFTAITTASIVVIPLHTDATNEWDIYSNYAQTGEAYNTHSQSDLATRYNGVNGTILEVDISGILTALAANDNVGIEIRLTDNADDVDVLGVRFKYS